MKTFNEFCVEAYQLDEFVKPLLKTALRGTAIGTGIEVASNQATKLFPKVMQPGVKKVLDVASWGPLAPVAGAYEFHKDDKRREDARREAAQAQSSSLPPGARWYGNPQDDIRRKPNPNTDRPLAIGRRYKRNYQGVGTQRP